MRPTIRDVAKKAGVAPTTVSRVVNGTGYVSEDTKQRVEQAIQDLGYIQNRVSRSLRLQKTNVVALVVSDITNPFWTTITRGVEDAIHQSGMSVILGNTDEDPDKLDRYLKVMLQQQVDGFLVAPTHENVSSIAAIQNNRVPLVLIDRFAQGIDADVVYGDSVAGAYQLTEYLIALGHQQIAVVLGPANASTSQQRAQGFRKACADHQVSINDDLVCSGGYNQQHGYDTTLRIFQTMEPKPTAVFAGNSQIAIGAMRALRALGLGVPADVSMVSFDDPTSEFCIEPFLTVIDQKPYQMGFRAAQLLLAFIHGEDIPAQREIILPPELIIRSSCRQI